MWSERVLSEVRNVDGPVLLAGAEPYGTPFLIERLAREATLVWMRALPRDRNDAAAQGNLLADALNRALGGSAFPSALPAGVHLHRLQRRRSDLAPLVLALSAAQHAPELAAALLSLHGDGYRVVLDADTPLPGVDVKVLSAELLQMTAREARAVAPAVLSDAAVERIRRDCGGRATEVIRRCLAAADLPAPTLPSPDGRLAPPGAAPTAEPSELLLALRREGRYLEALELAVMAAPEQVDEILQRAGPAYQERGLLERLHLLLSALPEPHRGTERVLEWRLVAGFAVADASETTEETDRHLAMHRAPALRARRAGTLPAERGFPMAEEALSYQEDPLTLFQAGRLDPDPESGARRLLAAVRLAEESGSPLEVVRNAGALGAVYLHDGRLDEANAWLEWAEAMQAEHGVRDGDRRLRILNESASVRLLLGETAGVAEALREAHAALEGAHKTLAAVLRTTVAAFAEVAGRSDEAHAAWHAAVAKAPRHALGHVALPYVTFLLREGELERARALALKAKALGAAERVGGRSGPADLAAGLVAWHQGGPPPSQAAEAMLEDPRLPLERGLAAACVLLAAGHALDHLPSRMRRALVRMPTALLERFLFDSRHVDRVREALGGPATSAQLIVTAPTGARLTTRDGTVPLPLRLAEVALLLAHHPDGLSDRALHAEMVGDGDEPGLSALRTHVSRLRSLLGVSGTPYRFTEPVETDLQRAGEALAQGRLRRALSECAGPVLAQSEAPGVVALREGWDEELRQAALASGDAEAILVLAERSEDDLALWEAAEEMLLTSDPRAPLVRARIRRLRRDYELPAAPVR